PAIQVVFSPIAPDARVCYVQEPICRMGPGWTGAGWGGDILTKGGVMARKQTRKQAQNREEPPPSGRELVQNLRQMIDEAEEMIVRAASHQVDEKVDELRMQLEEKLDRLKANYRQAEERVVDLAGAA